LNKVVIFVCFFAHKKYSRRLINLRLSRSDYFNEVFNFSWPASFNPLEAYGRVIQPMTNIIKSCKYTCREVVCIFIGGRLTYPLLLQKTRPPAANQIGFNLIQSNMYLNH